MERKTAILTVIWLIASLAVGQSTLHFNSVFYGGLFYILCSACGALGFFMDEFTSKTRFMIALVLAIASTTIVFLMRLGYFGL